MIIRDYLIIHTRLRQKYKKSTVFTSSLKPSNYMSILLPLSDTYFHFYTCISSNSLLKHQLDNSEDPILSSMLHTANAYAITFVLDVHMLSLKENA